MYVFVLNDFHAFRRVDLGRDRAVGVFDVADGKHAVRCGEGAFGVGEVAEVRRDADLSAVRFLYLNTEHVMRHKRTGA